jgi:hypothetical protein
MKILIILYILIILFAIFIMGFFVGIITMRTIAFFKKNNDNKGENYAEKKYEHANKKNM